MGAVLGMHVTEVSGKKHLKGCPILPALPAIMTFPIIISNPRSVNLPDSAAVKNALMRLSEPALGRPLADFRLALKTQADADQLHLRLNWPYPMAGVRAEIEAQIQAALTPLLGERTLALELGTEIDPATPPSSEEALTKVRNLIAVVSGKGGVGKSVTAVNLALALSLEGASVGLLDADIYGPSQRQMLGLPDNLKMAVEDGRWFEPVQVQGLKAMSMSFLVNPKTALVWRGPMASGALQQMLHQTLWGALDYLIVDMPPGTGDIQLSLAQKANVAGALVVTTPQDMALLDVRRAMAMLIKVKIPLLGVVENMSVFVCSGCGAETPLFGTGGGAKIAAEFSVELLEQLPLDPTLGSRTDSGCSPVIAEPDGQLAMIYRRLARKVGAQLALQAAQQAEVPIVQVQQPV